MPYGEYMGMIFPYSLLSPSKGKGGRFKAHDVEASPAFGAHVLV